MPVERVQVAVWEDHAGMFTARVLECQGVSAVGATSSAAVDQIKRYLAWLSQRGEFQSYAVFKTPEVRNLRVAIRPHHQTKRGSFPTKHVVQLRMPYITGKLRDRSVICCMPTIDEYFYCESESGMEPIVRDQIQRRLGQFTPHELARVLPPKQLQVLTVNVRQPSRGRWEFDIELPDLNAVAEPLADRAARKQFSRAWKRDALVHNIVERLEQAHANLLLVGPPGVGKTTALVEAARKFQARRKDQKRSEEDDDDEIELPPGTNLFWFTSGGRIIAGMQWLGEWEERCEAVIDELSAIQGVLCCDSLLGLIRAGGQTPEESVASFMLPYLEAGELRLICEATPEQLDACRRLLPGIDSLFQVVKVEEFDAETSQQVLRTMMTTFGRNVRVEWDLETVELIYRLFRRFVPYQPFPGNSAGFVKEVFDKAQQAKRERIDVLYVLECFARHTGLPEELLRDDVTLSADEVREEFRRRVIGQPRPCEAATSIVTTFKAGMNDPGKPLGVLLFCGPTGVGKTELAKAIADYMFSGGDATDRLVRLDMSEYSGPWSGDRLTTQPDGQPSELVKRLRRAPFCVLLLDEIEKASSEVFDVLLSVLDEGRLTDRFGRTTTLGSAVVVMTSNIGAEQSSSIGFDSNGAPRYLQEVSRFFRPEFFNRIDHVVAFDPLSQESIRQITEKELRELEQRVGLRQRGISLHWDDEVISTLARLGFDAKYGARPLQRVIERQVVARIAHWLAADPSAPQREVRLTVDPAGEIQVWPQ